MLFGEVDLPIVLDRAAPEPLREQLMNQLRRIISTGSVRADTPMPSSRALATVLGISRNTVMACYLELEGDGLVYGVHGSGTFVADQGTAPSTAERARVPDSAQATRVIDLTPGDIDPSVMARSTHRIMWRDHSPSGSPPPPAGLLELRYQLASYLGMSRGMTSAPEEIVLAAGTGEALTLLTLAMGWHYGGSIAVEDPGYPAVRRTFQRLGVRWTPFDATRQDAFPSQLRKIRTPPAAAYLTPSHQYPLGHRLDLDTRQELIRWSYATGCVLLEDDYDTEFRFDVPPIGSLAGLAPEANIVYMGTVSKALDPGLRITYLRIPQHLLGRVLEVREAMGATVSTPSQIALLNLLRSGEYARHIARVRRIYRDRRQALVEALRAAPGCRVTGADAGLHLVLDLPRGTKVDRLVKLASDRQVLVESLDQFRCAPDPAHPALAVSFGKADPAQLRSASSTILGLLEDPSIRGNVNETDL